MTSKVNYSKHWIHKLFNFSEFVFCQQISYMQKFIDYANDLAIIRDSITNATVNLHHLENSANNVGFYGSVCKTEFISFNP